MLLHAWNYTFHENHHMIKKFSNVVSRLGYLNKINRAVPVLEANLNPFRLPDTNPKLPGAPEVPSHVAALLTSYRNDSVHLC